jgi:hypothetical protein
MLGLAGTLRDTPDLYPERHMWLVSTATGPSRLRYALRRTT